MSKNGVKIFFFEMFLKNSFLGLKFCEKSEKMGFRARGVTLDDHIAHFGPKMAQNSYFGPK